MKPASVRHGITTEVISRYTGTTGILERGIAGSSAGYGTRDFYTEPSLQESEQMLKARQMLIYLCFDWLLPQLDGSSF